MPKEFWLKAGENGFHCCGVPSEYGGPGADFFYTIWSYLKRLGSLSGEQVSVFQFPQILLLIISCMEEARAEATLVAKNGYR